MKTSQTPQIYVGTYAKYNNGSIFGEWINLEIYDTKEDFFEYCKELHSDEDDAEFMFQDYENIPEKLISECSINDKLFDYVKAIEDMEDETIEALGYFLDDVNLDDFSDFDDLIEQFQEEYEGYFDGSQGAEVEFTNRFIEENGILDSIPESLQYYFDYEKYANDLFINDYIERNGHVFRRV
ncbi:MAG: antirestriction protein ArdA [Emticicia sp.]|nr:antirestriction protein ArdA [Emticicia sp.]